MRDRRRVLPCQSDLSMKYSGVSTEHSPNRLPPQKLPSQISPFTASTSSISSTSSRRELLLPVPPLPCNLLHLRYRPRRNHVAQALLPVLLGFLISIRRAFRMLRSAVDPRRHRRVHRRSRAARKTTPPRCKPTSPAKKSHSKSTCPARRRASTSASTSPLPWIGKNTVRASSSSASRSIRAASPASPPSS